MYRLYCRICEQIIELIHKLALTKKILQWLHLDWKVVEQFTRFIFVGVSNVVVTLIVYYVFLMINPRLYLIGNTFGYFAGVVNSYFLNSTWVFKKNGSWKDFSRTCGCYLITYFLQMGLLFLMVECLQWSDMVAPVINVIITTPINFILNKIWAFRA